MDCFDESGDLVLRAYHWEELPAVANQATFEIPLPSSQRGLDFIAAGLLFGSDERIGLVLNLSSTDRSRETVVLRYTPSTDCLDERGQGAPIEIVEGVRIYSHELGSFNGFLAHVDVGQGGVVGVQVVWPEDDAPNRATGVGVTRTWIEDVLSVVADVSNTVLPQP